MEADVLRNGLESPNADVMFIHYLVHFPKRPISQLPNDLPNVLWVHVSVHMFVLLLLFIGPQLEDLPKIEERHLFFFGRQLLRCGCAVFGYFRSSGFLQTQRVRMANEPNRIQALNPGGHGGSCGHSAMIMSIITSLDGCSSRSHPS